MTQAWVSMDHCMWFWGGPCDGFVWDWHNDLVLVENTPLGSTGVKPGDPLSPCAVVAHHHGDEEEPCMTEFLLVDGSSAAYMHEGGLLVFIPDSHECEADEDHL